MPSDIRSFFGGKSSQVLHSSQEAKHLEKKDEKPTRKGRSRVIDDSEDDEPLVKPSPKKTAPKRTRAPSPEPGPEVKPDEFFGSKNKPKRTETRVMRTGPVVEITRENTKPSKTAPASKKSNGEQTSAKKSASAYGSKKATTSHTKHKGRDHSIDPDDSGEDIHAAEYKKNGAKDDDYEESDVSEDEIMPKSRGRGREAKLKRHGDDADDLVMEDVKPVAEKGIKKGRKRASVELEDDDDFEEAPKPKKGMKASPAKKTTPAKKKTKQDDAPESGDVQAIFESIPTIRPPTPAPSGETKKFQFGAHANAGPAPLSGSKEIPQGAENCLAGLTFVFTGLLDSLDREEGQNLVKRYGGKVTSAPSKKTSYVVLGNEAGPKKLHTIRQHGLKTINEDGLFELIRKMPQNGGDSKAGAAYEKQKQKEQEKIEEMAEEMRKQEEARKKGEREAAAKTPKQAGNASSQGKPSVQSKPPAPVADTRLWTVKYAPGRIQDICGNKGQVEKLQRWLQRFPKNQKTNFKMAGPDGSGVYRAVIIHGPPGIGKTTAAHLVAGLEGYDVVESNASDTRSKRLIEEGLRGVLSTTSLLGYFAGDGQKVDPNRKKLVLIMDEVDGMSAGDRGGVGAMAQICKKSHIPIILICNDRKLPKMKPFDYVTYDLPFRRPTVDQVRSRIMTIAFREGLKIPPNVINALIEGSNSDIRQVVNMVSTAKLDDEAMTFDKSKDMTKRWEKHVILKPWDITNKILRAETWSEASKMTLNDKIELYFNDHEFSYLMLQENYLHCQPMRANQFSGRERNLKSLELFDKAAESISDGDLVDRMIHGPQQHWSLMPTHAVFSFVRPASFAAGSMATYRTSFTQWLGKNSAQGKFMRYIKEIQSHMRLRSAADRHAVRQQYVPILWAMLIQRLQKEGKEAVPEIIDLMDSYFLTKEDWDAIMELGVGPLDQENVKIESQAKSAFTRAYVDFPCCFQRGSTDVLTFSLGIMPCPILFRS
ncbi:replication factor RFC1 C terminal domain-containing protein [Lineolata rhizophorae]|uniref:Replication factor C subunit 1 n=1 Tax=Lineolata rhizophorae TaxID=578093 RepID=A0A6A6P9A2_9PEZI|nr:replication factor RFC1 C terminal domain-containing protein [Lineolata rhizophorae]